MKSGLEITADGNLTDDGVNTYVYDALGQTASITHSGGVTGYRYDAMGKRLVKTDSTGDRMYLYLGELFLSEFDPVTGQFTDKTGKHYFNARYLNAITDTTNPELPPRFLTPDIIIGTPANPQSWTHLC